MKRSMRSYERQVGMLTTHRLPQFLDHPLNAGQGTFDEEKLVLKIDFFEQNIEYFSGSMKYGYRVFERMSTKKVIKDGVHHKCGIRNIRFCKVHRINNKAKFVFANDVCLALCDVCLRSPDKVCDSVIGNYYK